MRRFAYRASTSIVCLAAFLLSLCPLCALAVAPARRALVLGNDSYPGNALHNARNDARSVGKAWKSLGYETTLVLDTDRAHMNRTMEHFAESVSFGDTVLVYYAGHGLQVDGENYLVPVDFQASDAADAKAQGYSLSSLLQKVIEHGATTQIIILDACRDNPFQFTRGIRSGWAPTITSAGSFLAFGTSPGSTAGDAPDDDHGVFTKSLLRYINDPQLDIEQVFQRVRKDVITSSGGKQVPWTASSLIGTFHMVPDSDLSSPVLSQAGHASQDDGGQVSRALSSGTSTSSHEGSSEDLLELMSQGRSLIGSSLWSEAAKVLRAALMLDPRCAVALRLLAVVLHMTGRSMEAEDTLSKAIELEPDEPMAYVYRCLFRAGRDVSASMEDCSRAIRLRDDLAVAHIGMALNWRVSSRNNLAAEEIDKAIALDPQEPCGYILRAEMLETEGRLEEARANYSKATVLSMKLLP